MARFKLLIEYAGTRYSGWQIQKNARTVQGEIDRAVREISKRREFELYGSGRTDAGVHALAQVAHLELYTALQPESLPLLGGQSGGHKRLSVHLEASGTSDRTRSIGGGSSIITFASVKPCCRSIA